ncbi:MAG: c-type cytochrome [Rubricella sp.]
MKIQTTLIAAAFAALGASAAAAQDAAAGEAAFRQCITCHVVQNDAGEVLAGRNARTGPNLYGVIGRQAGVVEDFRYRPSIVEAGEAGLVWDQENMTSYLLDTTAFLREYLGDNSARSGMTYRVRSEEDAANIAAYLATFSE